MPSTRRYYVYLITNWNNKVMYVGVTNNLEFRIYEHKNKLIKGFTKKHNVNKLVYFEETQDVTAAINREKEIKKWRREKKNQLVNMINPTWKDLSLEWQRFLPGGDPKCNTKSPRFALRAGDSE
jgi:putative endonuclease